uniref:Retrovirus-related Pol polyprotein from transposon TNT 1-94 n=1 Tax=Tanacetum cinerariifolium TaxID=118510 RepID=A0A6L2L6H8_TANCI|nr:retrovirus-related Pol polyprotein from transposon TNT 1-94 [Tanacetum cinerariifolium]
MMRAKFDIKKFDGTSDFGLWRIKMRALLIQHGCEAALEVLPANMEAQTKVELNKKAHSVVIVCLASYEHFVDTLLYGREALTLEDVMATLNSKKIKESSKANEDDGEGLYVRGRTDHRDSRQSRGKSRSKSRGGRLKCYICQSNDHLKRNCLKNNRKKSAGYVKKDEQPTFSGSKYDDSKVMIMMSALEHALLDWIMDLGCSYHMTPRLDIFFDFLECDGGSVQLGDNMECKIRGELNASVEEKDSLAQIWHKRLGHISEEGLQVLEKQGLFGKKSLDLWGLSQVESLGGKRYFLSIVDDYSKRLVENQTGMTVKKLRTDNGIEFYNREFDQLCIESGIARHLALIETLQQNGVAERMNKTLMDKSGHPSDYGMLRIFGCVAYPHDKQGKLEPRAVKCVLLGYPEGVKGYKLYRLDDELPKIVTSRNVVFNESVMYKDTLKDSGAAEEEDTHEPLTYQEAVACEDSSKWKAAIKEEMGSLRKNKTWELVDHLAGQKLVSCEWLFKIKKGIKGVQKPRYKARLVARGFTQRAGIDYNKVFSLIVRHTSIQVILALTACKDYELDQLNVKTTFLHGNLKKVIYMKQPPGYEQGNKVCLLKKSLYGLKQLLTQWYKRFDEYMLNNGFKHSSYDSCVYYMSNAPSEYIYLSLYIDDMMIACKSKAEIVSTKSLLKK